MVDGTYSELPHGTLLGHLRYIEHLNSSRTLFLTENDSGIRFLCLEIERHKKLPSGQETVLWGYIPVSPEREEKILLGKISVKEAFHHPEKETLFRVAKTGEKGFFTVDKRISYNIPDEWIPILNRSVVVREKQRRGLLSELTNE